ncbi:MAG: hypothetical protein ACYSUB_22365 [Planctomycetota bacterium]
MSNKGVETDWRHRWRSFTSRSRPSIGRTARCCSLGLLPSALSGCEMIPADGGSSRSPFGPIERLRKYYATYLNDD